MSAKLDVAAVVLPRAVRFWTVPLAAVVPDDALMSSEPAENPTLTIPAPEIVSASRARVWDDVSAVVLPIAVCPIEVAEATVLGPEITHAGAPTPVVSSPTLIPPAPDSDSALSAPVVELVEAVVLPMAY